MELNAVSAPRSEDMQGKEGLKSVTIVKGLTYPEEKVENKEQVLETHRQPVLLGIFINRRHLPSSSSTLKVQIVFLQCKEI